jgi:hypothetical protein
MNLALVFFALSLSTADAYTVGIVGGGVVSIKNCFDRAAKLFEEEGSCMPDAMV